MPWAPRIRPESSRVSLRARLTGFATGVVAITLAVERGAPAAGGRGTRCCTPSTTRPASRPRTSPRWLARGRLPDPVPVGAGTAGAQIVDAQGRVVAVSAGADRLTALLVPADVRAGAGRSGQGHRRRAARHTGLAAGRRLPDRRRRRPTGRADRARRGEPGRGRGERPGARHRHRGRRPDPARRPSPWSAGCSSAGRSSRSPGCGPGPRRSRRPGRPTAGGCRCRRPRTRSAGWPRRSTACSTGWRVRARPSARSSPTRRTSCAARSARSAPSSRSLGGTRTRRRGRTPPTACWPTRTGWPGWSTTCCCWPGPATTVTLGSAARAGRPRGRRRAGGRAGRGRCRSASKPECRN